MKHSIENERFVFTVHVVPRASRSEIVGVRDGVLRVRIAAPPVDGAANEELIRTLAKYFAVKRSAIAVVSGKASRTKRISIAGLAADRIQAGQF